MFLSWFRFDAGERTLKLEGDTSRNISYYLKNSNLKIECSLVLDFDYIVGVISNNEKLKTVYLQKCRFLFHYVFSNYFRLHTGEVTLKFKTHHQSN